MGIGSLSPYAQPQSGAPSWETGEREAACVFLSLTLFIILDVNVGIYRVFGKKQGLYYWSLIFATWGTAVVTIGNIFKNLKPGWSVIWPLWTVMINGGWSVCAPAECLVLYSRLHLVNQNERLHRGLLMMIIIGSFLVIVPNWVFVFPAYNPNPAVSSIWSPRMAIINRISQAVFTLFELVLSSIYILSLLAILRTRLDVRTRRVMRDLVFVNVLVIIMDLLVIVLIYVNKVNLAYPVQDFTYAFKFKIEFAVLNQLMAVATQGSRTASNRKKGATFEQRRYRRPGTTLMLKGYSDDDIGGVRLPFVSTTNERNQQNPHPNNTTKSHLLPPSQQSPPSMTEIPKPTLIHRTPTQTTSSSNPPIPATNEKRNSLYDTNFAFSTGPSLEFSASSNPSSRHGQAFLSDPAQDSDDTLLAPVADDHDGETLADTTPKTPPIPRQRRQRHHHHGQRNSLRQILLGWRRHPQSHNHNHNHNHHNDTDREAATHSPIATLNLGPLAGYSPPESIGHLAGVNARPPPTPPAPRPQRSQPPKSTSRWRPRSKAVDRNADGNHNNHCCGEKEDAEEEEEEEEEEEDVNGVHTWERYSRVGQELPWFPRTMRPCVNRAKTT